MITMTINGRVVQAEKGEQLLKVLRREKIDVPALCHHEAVQPFGACRLCMVEITKDSWNGWCDYVTSCAYPAADGLVVNTHAPKVNELRRTILDLYLARHPHSPEIRDLAAEYGVTKTSYETVVDGNNCILCAGLHEDLRCDGIQGDLDGRSRSRQRSRPTASSGTPFVHRLPGLRKELPDELY